MTPPFVWHGGALAEAKRHFGGEAWIDLSTGINPAPWPHADPIKIDWRRLPEREDIAALEAAAADHFGADPAHVCAVPGTEIGLRLIGGLIGGPAHHVAPSYRTHGEIFVGSRPIAWADAANCGNTLILANPNNPDGRIVPLSALHDCLAARGANDWLLVDEAFADCAPGTSIAHAVGPANNLVVFRSFGKFFGLAGLRLGFVIAPPDLIAALRRQLGAWPVSAAAIAIGTAAYRDRAWIAEARAALQNRSARLDALLARHGYRPTGECPLFRLIETPDAAALFERLARAAILTRPFAERPDWLRLGLPADDAALERLDTALAHG